MSPCPSTPRPAARGFAAAALAAALLGGCAASGTPEWDARFGDAARQLRAQQVLDADAPQRNQGRQPAVDARSTGEANVRYVDSFKAPPPTSVINIGVGGGAPR